MDTLIRAFPFDLSDIFFFCVVCKSVCCTAIAFGIFVIFLFDGVVFSFVSLLAGINDDAQSFLQKCVCLCGYVSYMNSLCRRWSMLI